MDFFDTVDEMGIVENHIQGVLKLEDSQASQLLKRYKEVRVELRDRLDRLPGDKFSAQQLRGVIVQLDGAIDAMSRSLKTGMKDASLVAALKGVENQITEIQAFSEKFQGAIVPINLNAQVVALDTSHFLVNQYEASIDAYSEDLRSSLIQTLTMESLAESPYSSIIQRMGTFFQGEEWKLHRIARTELHHIYGMGKLNGMTEVKDSTLPDLMKTLIQPMDARTGEDSKYAAKLNLIVELDKPFQYTWKGKKRIYMTPPDRPNDRSILVPYRKAWAE